MKTAEPPPRTTMHVTPGRRSDGVKTYLVEFINGRAEVPSNVGHYMLDNGLARRTRQLLVEAEKPRLILPRSHDAQNIRN